MWNKCLPSAQVIPLLMASICVVPLECTESSPFLSHLIHISSTESCRQYVIFLVNFLLPPSLILQRIWVLIEGFHRGVVYHDGHSVIRHLWAAVV